MSNTKFGTSTDLTLPTSSSTRKFLNTIGEQKPGSTLRERASILNRKITRLTQSTLLSVRPTMNNLAVRIGDTPISDESVREEELIDQFIAFHFNLGNELGDFFKNYLTRGKAVFMPYKKEEVIEFLDMAPHAQINRFDQVEIILPYSPSRLEEAFGFKLPKGKTYAKVGVRYEETDTRRFFGLKNKDEENEEDEWEEITPEATGNFIDLPILLMVNRSEGKVTSPVADSVDIDSLASGIASYIEQPTLANLFVDYNIKLEQLDILTNAADKFENILRGYITSNLKRMFRLCEEFKDKKYYEKACLIISTEQKREKVRQAALAALAASPLVSREFDNFIRLYKNPIVKFLVSFLVWLYVA